MTARELSRTQPNKNWFAWLRPAFVVPALAAILLIVSYQNFVSIPHIKEAVNQPRLLPWTSVNVGTYGDENQEIVSGAGKGVLLFVRIPPDSNNSSYTANLFGPTGKLEWALPVPAKTTSDQWPVAVPGACCGAGERAYSGEGLVGLSWAFLRAGAHNVIAALWEAADVSTEELMKRFYDELDRGATADVALRTAKLSLLHETAFHNPFYWAPFQLYTRS